MDNDLLVNICGHEFCASHQYLTEYGKAMCDEGTRHHGPCFSGQRLGTSSHLALDYITFMTSALPGASFMTLSLNS